MNQRRNTNRSTVLTLAGLVALLLGVQEAPLSHADDQTIRGLNFKTLDPRPGGDSTRRLVFARAREQASPNTIVGDPIAAGATLEIIVEGATPSAQSFTLPAGSSLNGRPRWQPADGGFKYRDPDGENGPVTRFGIRKWGRGVFEMRAVIDGDKGEIVTLPPNPGTSAYMILHIHDGDRYCVQFGDDGERKNRGERAFYVKQPVAEGCPREPTTCLGARVGPGCWFLGESKRTCTETCAANGLTYDDVTASYAGSGGTDAQCDEVLSALTPPDFPAVELDCDEDGLGCFNYNDNIRHRCGSPSTTADASQSGVLRACACK